MDTAQQSYPPTERQVLADWTASHGDLSILREQIENQQPISQPQEAFVKLLGWVQAGPRTVSDSAMVCLGLLFRRGYSPEFLKSPCAVGSLFKYFNVLSRELGSLQPQEQASEEGASLSDSMLGVLSLLSQLIHDNPHWSLPLTRRFVQNVLKLSPQLVAASLRKNQILRLLSVMLEAFSRQHSFLKDNELLERYRNVLLLSYSMVEDAKTLMRYNRCLKQLIAQSSLTLGEARQYKLVETMTRFFEKGQLTDLLRSFKLKQHKNTPNEC